jgi:hypothetical protein
MGKQKLSIKAAVAKKKRDLAYALTPARRKKKAHAQRMRNKAGSKANGMDWDHKDGKFKSVKKNRGNDGDGTKSEGKKNYKFIAYKRK